MLTISYDEQNKNKVIKLFYRLLIKFRVRQYISFIYILK